MKKLLTLALVSLLVLTACTALADKTNADSALDAFNNLTLQSVAPSGNNQTSAVSEEYLAGVMAGTYLKPSAELQSDAHLALTLTGLSGVTSTDIAAYAKKNNLPAEQVRNTYFQSLANVLRAEIAVNPAAEAQHRNVQLVLSLFLENENTSAAAITRDAIRKNMTKDHAQTIANDYSLPLSFVEFMIMDDDWDDSDFLNDDDWSMQSGYVWHYGNTPDNTPDLTPDNTPDYTSVTAPVPTVPSVSYTNTPDRTPDNTPDNTPDYNTPDNTPDYNTPDNTPDNT